MITGGCLCGAVRYETEGPILWAGHCHCDSCRKGTGAGVVSFFGVPRAGVAWSGEMTVYRSSTGVERGFCSTCGASMIYRWTGWPDETHLFAASLDDPALFKPEAHYHFAEHVDWLSLGDSLPRYRASADADSPMTKDELDG